LPAVAVVTVVCRDDHDPALLIQNRPDVHLGAVFPTAILARVTFPSDAIGPARAALSYIRRLQFVLGNLEIKDAVKNEMLHREFNELAVGQHPLDLLMNTLPLPFSPKVVRHE